jgi:hypothetical protein
MRRSDAVREGIRDPGAFEAGLASGQGVSVIGTRPAEGHGSRDDWIAAYRSGIAELGVKLRGDDPVGFEQGAVCYCTDTPSFVFPDGSRLPTATFACTSRSTSRRVPRWAAARDRLRARRPVAPSRDAGAGCGFSVRSRGPCTLSAEKRLGLTSGKEAGLRVAHSVSIGAARQALDEPGADEELPLAA